MAERLAGRDDVVTAILAAPDSTVVSGPAAAVAELTGRWQADGVGVLRVATDVAFHSRQMDALTDELAAAAAELSPRPPRIPMYSTTLADPRAPVTADGGYWAANLREPVRLEAAVRAATEDGYRSFLEVSAHPVVAHSISETLAALDVPGTFVGSSLRRNRPETSTLLAAAAALYGRGLPLDWTRLQPGALISLPGYPWQHRPHWRQSTPVTGSVAHDPGSATLLGAEVEVADRPLRLWQTRLTAETRPYPGSHIIDGTEVVPAATLIGTLLAAAAPDGGLPPALSQLSLTVPLLAGEPREVQVVADGDSVRIASRAAGSRGGWLGHVTGTVAAASAVVPPLAVTPATPGDPASVRRRLSAVGVPSMAFDWTVEELARGDGTLRTRVLAGSSAAGWAPLLDAALSIAPVLFPGPPVLRMVRSVAGVRIAGDPPECAELELSLDTGDAVQVRIADPAAPERALAWLTGLRYAVVDLGQLSVRDPAALVAELAWRPWPLPAPADGPAQQNRPAGSTHDRRPIAVYGPDAAATAAFADRLRDAGADCTAVADVAGIAEPTDLILLPAPPAPGESVPEAAARSAWLLTDAVQRLAAPARLWCVTTGVAESATEAQLALAPLWGVGRVVAGERPGSWGGVLDLPPAGLDPARPAWIRRRPACWCGSWRQLPARTFSPCATGRSGRPGWSGQPSTGGPGRCTVSRRRHTWSPAGWAPSAWRWPSTSPTGVPGTWCWPAAGNRPVRPPTASARCASAACRCGRSAWTSAISSRRLRCSTPWRCRRSAAWCTPPGCWTTG